MKKKQKKKMKKKKRKIILQAEEAARRGSVGMGRITLSRARAAVADTTQSPHQKEHCLEAQYKNSRHLQGA